ncbi:hypothetical protein BESB_036550 [Besnoitia besnoiti]|uniref:Uncharacterized protein n=1 Tax=Besnoitia besnoiti TaxID=94643 RepID=A0A2A9MN04_BESBE|nr:hypothetical protein BESB_036550 [Besnoitia besnoiti]PFH37197.1 hypothetical protein BESB_036550 [Besnoitia besnoiti]
MTSSRGDTGEGVSNDASNLQDEKEEEGMASSALVPARSPLLFSDDAPTAAEEAQVKELENVISEYLSEREKRRQFQLAPVISQGFGVHTPRQSRSGRRSTEGNSEEVATQEGNDDAHVADTQEDECEERERKRMRHADAADDESDSREAEREDPAPGSDLRLIYDAHENMKLTVKSSKTQFNERPVTLDLELKRKLVRRAVMLLLFAAPYAARQSDLREVILIEPTVKKINVRVILKEAARLLRGHLGLLLQRINDSRGSKADDFYYLAQGIAHARHIESLMTEREHALRGFLLFLVPCFIACRGVISESDLRGYVTACGRADILGDFSESDLGGLALPENQKVHGKSLKDSPPRLETLWDFLLECRHFKYLTFVPGSTSDSPNPQLSCIKPTARLRDELSLENFRRECKANWDVRLPSGDLFGRLEASSENEESDEASESSDSSC